MLSPGADVRGRCNTAKRRTCWASEDAENRIIQTSAEIHASPGVCLWILSFCPIWTPFFKPHMDIFTGFVPIQKMRNKIHLQHKTSSVQHQKSLTQNPLPSGKPPFSYDFPMVFLWFSRKYHGKNIPTPHVSSVSGRRTQEKTRSARIALTGLRELRSATRSHPKKN
jgi:hypothetical protein